jgi:hypothetical protein
MNMIFLVRVSRTECFTLTLWMVHDTVLSHENTEKTLAMRPTSILVGALSSTIGTLYNWPRTHGAV